jgi:DNA-binding response OmpR family regulator
LPNIWYNRQTLLVLLIEDDTRIASNIEKFLTKHSYLVKVVGLAGDAMAAVEIDDYDIILLDIMLPDGNGFDICRQIRQLQNNTPIMLTAKSQLEDKIEGLTLGADDYLTKPFALDELLARIKAIIRRKSGISTSPVLIFGNIEINTNTCEVKRGNRIIELAPKEYSLLEYLAQNSCRVVNRLELLSHVWGEEIDQFSNTVDVHIRYLRQKLTDPKGNLIKTIKNRGYMLCSD